MSKVRRRRSAMPVVGMVVVAMLATAPAHAGGSVRATAVPRTAAPAFVPGELIVRFRPGTGAARRAAVREDGDARLQQSLPLAGMELLRLAPGASVRAAAADFERDRDVLYAEPNFNYQLEAIPNDPRFPELWGLNNTGQSVNGASGTPDADIDAPEAWNTTTGSASVTVGVVDSGLAYDDPDLAPNIWSNPGEIAGNGVDDDHNGYTDDVRGWDFVDTDNSPRDLNGHGTHVAGTVGARGNDGVGVAGVSWGSRLMPLRACGARGTCPSDAVIEAMAYAASNGARIVNLSIGSADFSQPQLDVINAAPNVLFVAAAGNDGLNLDTPGVDDYPCEQPAANVICVAATDQNDTLASFSNFGATAVDLAAPGVSILSTLAAPDTVFSEGFESDIGARWTTGCTFGGSACNNTWARTSERAKTGSFSLADSPGGNYANNTDSFARPTNAFSLTGRTDCTLLYELQVAIPAGDVLVVGGSTNAAGWFGLDALVGSTGGAFIPLDDSLNALNGQASAWFRFRMVTDGATTDDGEHIDDVRVLCPALSYDASDFAFLHGTSMATPHVSGTLALMRADTPGVSAAELRQRLLANVDAKASLAGKTVTGGRLNAAKAVESAPPPVVATQPATAITRTGATLNGTVNPRGHVTSYRFEYGTTTGYGQSTPLQSAGSGDAVVTVNAAVTGLTAGTTYHYRLVATDAEGTVAGADAQFTTPLLPPAVTAQPASDIRATTALLSGTVDPRGVATSYHFEYGTTTGYGQSTPTADAGAVSGAQPVSAQLSGLSPETTYHFRLVATNADGTTVTADAQFTTTPLTPPLVTLASPTSVGQRSATLNGTVNPRGQATTYHFQYGTTESYGQVTPTDVAGSGVGPVDVHAAVVDLAPGTTYHFRLVAENADGTAVSDDGQFTTAPLVPPVVTLASPTSVGQRSATLNGTVDPRGKATTSHFEYGLTESYGQSTPPHDAGDGSGAQAVSEPLNALTPGTTYHFRLIADNVDGTAVSGDAQFTTAPLVPPLVVVGSATLVGERSATLNATVDPRGKATTYRFEYGTTTGYGTSTPDVEAGNGSGAQPVSAPLSGLTPGTAYHFRLVAENVDGTTVGDDAQFTTAPPVPPVLALKPTTAMTPTGATVNGTVDPRGHATTYHFEYGTTTSYGLLTPSADAGAGSGAQPVSAVLSGLAPSTAYHFRLVATSEEGTAHSADDTFTTPARPRPPQVSTGAASALSQTAATVGATVNPNGQATTYRFQYGRSTAYGAQTPTRSAGAGRAAVAVSAALSGLQPGTTYHYRVIASNPTGTVAGADRVLTTTAPPPALEPFTILAPGTLRLDRRGAVTIRLAFPASTPAGTGRAELFRGPAPATTTHWRSLAPLYANLARLPKRLGAKSFATRPGETVRVRIPLTRAARRLVAKRGSVKATLRVTVLTQVETKAVRLKPRRR